MGVKLQPSINIIILFLAVDLQCHVFPFDNMIKW